MWNSKLNYRNTDDNRNVSDVHTFSQSLTKDIAVELTKDFATPKDNSSFQTRVPLIQPHKTFKVDKKEFDEINAKLNAQIPRYSYNPQADKTSIHYPNVVKISKEDAKAYSEAKDALSWDKNPVQTLNDWFKNLNSKWYNNVFLQKKEIYSHWGISDEETLELTQKAVASEAFKIYQEKVWQREEIIKKYSWYDNAEALKKDIDLLEYYSKLAEKLKKPDIKSWKDLEQFLVDYNIFSNYTNKEKARLQKIMKYFQNRETEGMDKYNESIERLSIAMSQYKSNTDIKKELRQEETDNWWKNLQKDFPWIYQAGSALAGYYDSAVETGGAVVSTVLMPLKLFVSDNTLEKLMFQTSYWTEFLKSPASTSQKEWIYSLENWLNITSWNLGYAVLGSVLQMMTLLWWAKAIATWWAKVAGKIGANVSQKALQAWGLISSSMIMQLWSSFDQAIRVGLNRGEAFLYSVIQSGIQAGLELVSPNEFFFRSAKLSGWKQILKMITKEILSENLQEASQLVAENWVNYIANHLTNSKFPVDFSWENFVQTAVLTTLTTGLVAGKAGIQQGKAHKNLDILKKKIKDNPSLKKWVSEMADKVIKWQIVIEGIGIEVAKQVKNTINNENIEEKARENWKETKDKNRKITYEELLQSINEKMENPTDETSPLEQPINIQEIKDAMYKNTVKNVNDVEKKEEVHYTESDLDWFDLNVYLTDKWLRIGDVVIDRDFTPRNIISPEWKYVNMYNKWYTSYEWNSFQWISQNDTRYATLIPILQKINFPAGYIDETGRLCDEDSFYITLPMTADKWYVTLIINKFGWSFSYITGWGTILTPLVHIQIMNNLMLWDKANYFPWKESKLNFSQETTIKNSKFMDITTDIQVIRDEINRQSLEKLGKKLNFTDNQISLLNNIHNTAWELWKLEFNDLMRKVRMLDQIWIDEEARRFLLEGGFVWSIDNSEILRGKKYKYPYKESRVYNDSSFVNMFPDSSRYTIADFIKKEKLTAKTFFDHHLKNGIWWMIFSLEIIEKLKWNLKELQMPSDIIWPKEIYEKMSHIWRNQWDLNIIEENLKKMQDSYEMILSHMRIILSFTQKYPNAILDDLSPKNKQYVKELMIKINSYYKELLNDFENLKFSNEITFDNGILDEDYIAMKNILLIRYDQLSSRLTWWEMLFNKDELENLTKKQIQRIIDVHNMPWILGSLSQKEVTRKANALFKEIKNTDLIRFLMEWGFTGKMEQVFTRKEYEASKEQIDYEYASNIVERFWSHRRNKNYFTWDNANLLEQISSFLQNKLVNPEKSDSKNYLILNLYEKCMFFDYNSLISRYVDRIHELDERWADKDEKEWVKQSFIEVIQEKYNWYQSWGFGNGRINEINQKILTLFSDDYGNLELYYKYLYKYADKEYLNYDEMEVVKREYLWKFKVWKLDKVNNEINRNNEVRVIENHIYISIEHRNEQIQKLKAILSENKDAIKSLHSFVDVVMEINDIFKEISVNDPEKANLRDMWSAFRKKNFENIGKSIAPEQEKQWQRESYYDNIVKNELSWFNVSKKLLLDRSILEIGKFSAWNRLECLKFLKEKIAILQEAIQTLEEKYWKNNKYMQPIILKYEKLQIEVKIAWDVVNKAYALMEYVSDYKLWKISKEKSIDKMRKRWYLVSEDLIFEKTVNNLAMVWLLWIYESTLKMIWKN